MYNRYNRLICTDVPPVSLQLELWVANPASKATEHRYREGEKKAKHQVVLCALYDIFVSTLIVNNMCRERAQSLSAPHPLVTTYGLISNETAKSQKNCVEATFVSETKKTDLKTNIDIGTGHRYQKYRYGYGPVSVHSYFLGTNNFDGFENT